MAMADPVHPSKSSSSLPAPRDLSSPIHSRREPFDHGLLPIPKLIFPDPAQILIPLKKKLLHLHPNHRINSAAISDFFQISIDHARLVLDTLASVHHSESDPIVGAKSDEIDLIGADVHDLLLFLYIQSYKRLLPRTHKDAAVVADVWPSTSAFDGYLSALSPLQLVRSNSRRSMPSLSDEEAHQLSYIKKHLANILSLLAEPVDEECKETMVLTMNGFDHLGFLVQFEENGSDGVRLSQFAPFFTNSDPDMPAAPVLVGQVHDWMIQNISSALEHISERASPKDNGASASDQDVPMTDAFTSSVKVLTNARSVSFIEGVSKLSLVKQASELNGSTVKVLNCHDSVIYIFSPLKYATINGCSDTTIFLGAIGKAVRIEHCERVHVIAVAKRVCIANCRECLFYLGVNERPLILGDNHKLQVAPYNTYYSQLEEHMAEVGVVADINRWDESLALGVVDPHDSLSHPAGVSDIQAELATRLDPDQFTNFLIPNWFVDEFPGCTKCNPFPLPDVYLSSHQRNLKNLFDIKQALKETLLEDTRKRELSCALHASFKDWLYASGNIRQLYCLQGE